LPADSPFLRSIVDHATELRGLLSCTVGPGRGLNNETIIEPLADGVADPEPPSKVVPTIVVAGFHGGLLTDATARHDMSLLLAGRPVASSRTLTALERIVRLTAGAWQVPSLPLSLYAGHGAKDNPSCATMESDVRSWIGL
jgi:hypothetical protein